LIEVVALDGSGEDRDDDREAVKPGIAGAVQPGEAPPRRDLRTAEDIATSTVRRKAEQ
jgi:hypothetical protein